MADYMKSSESLECNQLGKRERWYSGSLGRATFSEDAASKSRGWRQEKELYSWGPHLICIAVPKESLVPEAKEQGQAGEWWAGWHPEQALALARCAHADSGLPGAGAVSVWPAGPQAKLLCPHGLSARP